MKRILSILVVAISLQAYAGKQTPHVREAHVSYDSQIPILSIIGRNLCAKKHQDGIRVDLGEVQLTDISCQMLGTLADPIDVITAPLLHLPAPGDYKTRVIITSGKKSSKKSDKKSGKKSSKNGRFVQFYLTLGATGPQGIEGPRGLTGNTGLQGPIADTGPQGVQGLTGAIGPRGVQGLTGNIGQRGIQGPKGDTGDQGNKGNMGPAGISGSTGATGPKGDTGATGESGISQLASLACPENHYLAGFQLSGELLCRELPLLSGTSPTDPSLPTAESDPDFATACFTFNNSTDQDINNNDWFDDCIKSGAVSLRILVKDDTGNTIYDESATISNDWSQNSITSTAGSASQHIFSVHDQLLTMTNNDRMIITGKNASSTTGCFSSFSNGYGIIIYNPTGSASNGIRLMLMGYDHGILGTPRNITGWSESNEISFSAAGDLIICGNSPLVSDAAHIGSIAIFVE